MLPLKDRRPSGAVVQRPSILAFARGSRYHQRDNVDHHAPARVTRRRQFGKEEERERNQQQKGRTRERESERGKESEKERERVRQSEKNVERTASHSLFYGMIGKRFPRESGRILGVVQIAIDRKPPPLPSTKTSPDLSGNLRLVGVADVDNIISLFRPFM